MQKHERVAIFALVASSCMFATGYLLTRAHDPQSGMGALIVQSLFAGAVTLTILVGRVNWKPPGEYKWHILFNGICSPLILYFVWTGAKVVTPALASIIVISNVLMIALASWALGRKKFNKAQAASLTLGFLGVVWISVERGALGGEGAGVVYLLIGAVLIATTTVVMEVPVKVMGGASATLLAMWSGFFVSLIFILATGGFEFYSLEQTGVAFTMGIVSIVLPVLFFNIGMNRIGAADAAAYKLLIPFFALVYGVIFLGEIPGFSASIGGLAVVASVAAYQRTGNAKDGVLEKGRLL
ncbi:Permease of the drug/metabolite transporter (DMT) superfamily [hydrothermal vent metagenome]|uniref:Permease of the drug/metabolite transporter (DMT) superfamily n=1 Tax=hydrothermal vent metagenome TaxID=652676 RepID=A0A3B1D6W2_9ZZZZ